MILQILKWNNKLIEASVIVILWIKLTAKNDQLINVYYTSRIL